MKIKDTSAVLWMPRYSFADADYLAGVGRGTSKRWLEGYEYRRRDTKVSQPSISGAERASDAVSFVDLVEVVAIGKLKDFGFSLRSVREIVKNCQEMFETERPLVTLSFKIGGREAFVERDGALMEVGRHKRMSAWKEVLIPFLQDLDYSQEEVVHRWWPLGRQNIIVLDPEYGYGYPVIQNSGVRTEIVLERFKAGDPEDLIASDFNLDPSDVQRALRFELLRAA
jgi:uncharacterized protein (DUF433 family)